MASRSQITIPIKNNIQHKIQYSVTRLWVFSELKDKENTPDKKGIYMDV